MTMQAEIDAVVQAFVEDLAEMVRRTALSAVQSALGDEGSDEVAGAGHAPPPRAKAPVAARAKATAAKTTPKKAAKPAPKRGAAPPDRAPEEEEEEPEAAAPPPPPAPLRKRLDPQRRGRLIVVPSTPAPAPKGDDLEPLALDEASISEPAKPASKAEPAPQARAVEAPSADATPEPTPAKKWVIVRRPARDRGVGASEAPSNGQRPSEPAPAPESQPIDAPAEAAPEPAAVAPAPAATVAEPEPEAATTDSDAQPSS